MSQSSVILPVVKPMRSKRRLLNDVQDLNYVLLTIYTSRQLVVWHIVIVFNFE